MENLCVVACLGNPGDKYRMTWHNAGFWVADIMSAETGVKFINAGAFLIAEFRKFSIIKPVTYMNKSGEAVCAFLEAKELTASNLLVVCDDVNLDFGQLRLRTQGSHGGHNGLRSIIDTLETDGFSRLRLGIGPYTGSGDMADYVLKKISGKQEEDASVMAHKAADCVFMALNEGIQTAQNIYNSKL